MLHKQLTRKEFLTAGLSIVGLFVMSRVPKVLSSVKDSLSSSDNKNTYGNNSYGGGRKNV